MRFTYCAQISFLLTPLSVLPLTPCVHDRYNRTYKYGYSAFGFAAAILEGLPIVGLVFSISNRIGAAMWAHGTSPLDILAIICGTMRILSRAARCNMQRAIVLASCPTGGRCATCPRDVRRACILSTSPELEPTMTSTLTDRRLNSFRSDLEKRQHYVAELKARKTS